MKTSLAVFVLGVIALSQANKAAHLTFGQIAIALGFVFVIALVVAGVVHVAFRGRKKDKKQQSSGFGYATRTGRS